MLRSRTPLRLLTLALSLVAVPAAAQSPAMAGFEPNDDYLLEVAGEKVAAEVFLSPQVRAFLVLSEALPGPVLVEPRSREVSTLDLMKVDRQGDGRIDILADAVLAPQGAFQVAGDGVTFTVDGVDVGLRTRPPLLGEHDAAGMVAYNAGYGRAAEEYTASEPILRQLKEQSQEVRVRVYFGSWCPFCQQVLPRVIRVAKELEGSKVSVEFYGLPRQIGSDREASEMDIHGVPTGVVFVGGREAGRIQGNGWKIPELAIKNAIDGAA